jgi:hypothetical protein
LSLRRTLDDMAQKEMTKFSSTHHHSKS